MLEYSYLCIVFEHFQSPTNYSFYYHHHYYYCYYYILLFERDLCMCVCENHLNLNRIRMQTSYTWIRFPSHGCMEFRNHNHCKTCLVIFTLAFKLSSILNLVSNNIPRQIRIYGYDSITELWDLHINSLR